MSLLLTTPPRRPWYPPPPRARSGSVAPYTVADPGRIVQDPKPSGAPLVGKVGKALIGTALASAERKMASADRKAALAEKKLAEKKTAVAARKTDAKGTGKKTARIVRHASEIIAEETDTAIQSLAGSRHAITTAMAALSTPPPAPANPRFVPLESP